MYKLCKTEQSARRQRELEQKLVSLMILRRYEEISVSDFCAYAEIPRKAFYRYFSSKDGALYSLIDHALLEYDVYSMEYHSDDSRDLFRDIEGFFLFWKQQKLLLDGLKHGGISGVLMERAIERVTADSSIAQLLPRDTPEMRTHVVRFAISGLMILMISWHHGGYQESTKEMAQIAARLVTQPLFPRNI